MPQLCLFWKVQLSPHHMHSLIDQNIPKAHLLPHSPSLLSQLCSENTKAFYHIISCVLSVYHNNSCV